MTNPILNSPSPIYLDVLSATNKCTSINRPLVSTYRDQLLNHQMMTTTTDNDHNLGPYPAIDMCSPLQLVKSPPPSSIYAPPSPIPSHIPVRHPFAKPPAPLNISPEKQYSNFRVGSFEASPADTASTSLRSQYPQPPPSSTYEPPVGPEPSKVYRKSPFLPRKTKSPESSLAPKKESKLSTLGSWTKAFSSVVS